MPHGGVRVEPMVGHLRETRQQTDESDSCLFRLIHLKAVENELGGESAALLFLLGADRFTLTCELGDI